MVLLFFLLQRLVQFTGVFFLAVVVVEIPVLDDLAGGNLPVPALEMRRLGGCKRSGPFHLNLAIDDILETVLLEHLVLHILSAALDLIDVEVLRKYLVGIVMAQFLTLQVEEVSILHDLHISSEAVLVALLAELDLAVFELGGALVGLSK